MSDEKPSGSTHERLDAVEAVVPVLEERSRKTLSDARIIIGLVVAALAALSATAGGGWAAYAQVRSAATEDNKPLVARVEGVETKQTATDASVAEQNRKIANIERTVMTLDLNMRLMLESRGIKPIDVPADPDGGR